MPALTLAGLGLFQFCYFGLLARLDKANALRWTVAFVFGLIHGFGFAGVLIDADLSTARMARALLGFKIWRGYGATDDFSAEFATRGSVNTGVLE